MLAILLPALFYPSITPLPWWFWSSWRLVPGVGALEWARQCSRLGLVGCVFGPVCWQLVGWLAGSPVAAVVDAGRRAVGGMHRLVVARRCAWLAAHSRACAHRFGCAGAVAGVVCRGAGAHPSVSISCCRCSPWCGWLTSLRILPAGLLACALPATSWHPPSARQKLGRVWGGLAGVLCLAVAWVVADRYFQADVASFIPACIPLAGGSWPSPWCSWWP